MSSADTDDRPPRPPTEAPSRPTTLRAGAARRASRPSSATPSSARHIEPGDDLWVRVTRRRLGDRRPRSAKAQARLHATSTSSRPSTGCRRRSAGTRTPRSTPPLAEQGSTQPGRRSTTGLAGGDTRFQVLARVVDVAPRTSASPQGRPARRRPRRVDTWIARLRRRRLARARDAGRCSASPSSAIPTCATSTCPASSRASRCARTSRCWPAVVKPWPGHRRRRAHARRGPDERRGRGRRDRGGEPHDRRHRAPAARATSPRRPPTPGSTSSSRPRA